MDTNRRGTLHFPVDYKAKPWKVGDQVEGSLALSSPSFPSEQSCKLEPSTIRGVVSKQQGSMPPRRASAPLLSPTTVENINKWLAEQEKAKLDHDHIKDAEACCVTSTRPDAVKILPLNGTQLNIQHSPEFDTKHQILFSESSVSDQDQDSMQLNEILELKRHEMLLQEQVRARNHKIADLEEANADLAHQAIASNERTFAVKKLTSFTRSIDADIQPMDHVHYCIQAYKDAAKELKDWMSCGSNPQALLNQFPELVGILDRLQIQSKDLIDDVEDLARDCEDVYSVMHASDDNMVEVGMERYRMEMAQRKADKAIEKKFPALHFE